MSGGVPGWSMGHKILNYSYDYLSGTEGASVYNAMAGMLDT